MSGFFVSSKAAEAAIKAVCPTPAAKLLLIVLAARVDGNMQCFPKLATLRADTGITSDRTLNAHLQALQAAGLLRIETDHVPTGRQTSNIYTVLLEVEGATPAAAQSKPRRVYQNTRRPVGKVVDKSAGKPALPRKICGVTPQNLRGTHPAKSAPLEPLQSNQEARTGDGTGFSAERRKPTPAEEAEAKTAAKALKGLRYTLPGSLAVREPPGETQAQMAARLRAVVR